MKDFSLQGKVYLGASLAGGKPGAMHWVNDAGVLQISPSVSQETRQESHSGNRLTSATLNTSTEVSFTLTLYHGTAKNLALGLYGSVRDIVAGTVTDEEIPTVGDGDMVVLDRGGISALTIEDSDGAPPTLVEDTHYRIVSADGGVLEMLDVAALTQPLLADYENGAATDLTMFTQQAPIRYLMLDGMNTVDGSGEKVRVRLYKLKFNPVSQLDLINSSFGEISLTGTCLFESGAAMDEALGGFGRIELLEAS